MVSEPASSSTGVNVREKSSPASKRIAVLSAAILARYDFGFFDCELQIRQNKGILAVTTFNRFHDESGRSNYVNRELFHRESPSEV